MRQEDRCFFEEVIVPLYSDLFSFLCRLTRDTVLAADLTQETMRIAWEKVERIRAYNNTFAALLAISRNRFFDYHRKRRRDFSRQGEEANPWETGNAESDPLFRYLSAESAWELRQLIKCLRSEYAELILLRYYEGLSFGEIARRLNCNYNTIISWHRRALAELRKSIKTGEK